MRRQKILLPFPFKCTKYFRDDLMLCLCRSIGITFHRSFVQGYVCDSAIPVQLAS